jgi:hypothetical protein
MTNEELKSAIAACDCAECRALTGLLNEAGAKFQISTVRGGRFCEMAVVAAAGERGLPAGDIVPRRRRYAEHLGIQLSGNTQNDDKPNHIMWATKHSNHHPDASDPGGRINLGLARAVERDGSFFLTWTSSDKPRFVKVPFYVEQDGGKTLFLPSLATTSGFWIGPKGEERCVPNYWDALNEVSAMSTPRFRRENAAGNRGIVACKAGDVEEVKASYIERLIGQLGND